MADPLYPARVERFADINNGSLLACVNGQPGTYLRGREEPGELGRKVATSGLPSQLAAMRLKQRQQIECLLLGAVSLGHDDHLTLDAEISTQR